MLPSYASSSRASVASGRTRFSAAEEAHRSASANLFRYLRRMIYYPQMDFQYTLTQMRYLLHAPSKVYKLTSWRNQTKAQWARDDPAFLVILCALITVGTSGFALALGAGGFLGLLRLILLQLAIFALSGGIIASFWWWVANKYFGQKHSHSVDQRVEWLYSFDIHCNAYWPLSIALYVVQLLLLPVLTPHTFFSTLLANILYGGAFSYYGYVTFLGYMYLPFLRKDMVTNLLYPIAAIIVIFVVMTFVNANASRLALAMFFS